jgi:tRNA dimethylallyltransferase
MGDVPHRLYGVVGCKDVASAATWAKAARVEARAVWASGRMPILVGGTGLYLRTFLDGLAPVPDIPPAVRRAVRERLADFGPAKLHAELARRDPATAATLRPSDPQRIARAFEVTEATGKGLLWWQGRPARGRHPGPVLSLVLDPPREHLYAACDRRFGRMLGRGAVDEAAAVLGLGLPPDRPCLKALGLAELDAYLRGEATLAEASARARRATRRYAKRQVTWFRHQMPGAERLREPRLSARIACARGLAGRFAVDHPVTSE